MASRIRYGVRALACGLGIGVGLAAAGGRVSGASPARPTYHGAVERVLQQHCQDCHRPGQVAPFSLLTYEQARKRAADLETVTGGHAMPPWPASTTEGGPFRDARVLSDAEIATVADWVAADCPKGDPKDAPPARTWDSDWALGTPDLVLTLPEPFDLGAEGSDEHRVFVIPTGLTAGKWVTAVDFKPGNAKVVHHVLCAFDVTGQAKRLDDADPRAGYQVFGGFGVVPSGSMGGWAPGSIARPLPTGVGRYLPAKADLLLQVHYHKSGKPETDATRVGLYFSKQPIDKQLAGAMVLPTREGLFRRPVLTIPAGDPAYEVKASTVLKEDSHVTSVTPHMHWLGKDFLLTATRPDGTTATLIKIDHWDFNWQGQYEFMTPVAVPQGTKVEMVAHFDNSADNAANPSKPPKVVHWGEQTTDEMAIGFLQRTIDKEHRDNQPPARFQTGPAAKPAPAGAGALNISPNVRAHLVAALMARCR